MLPSILAKIEMIIRTDFQISEKDLKKLIGILASYHKDMWIYPGVLKRKTSIPIQQVNSILYRLSKEGYLNLFYELRCYNCQNSFGSLYEVINSIPYDFECEYCHSKQLGIENAYMIYKVICS